jgi:hypothetical protein
MTLRWREMDSNLWYHSTKAGNSEASRGSRVEDLAFVVDGTTRNEAGEFLSSSQIVAKLLGRGRGCGQSVRRTRQTADTFKPLPLSREHLELCASRGRNLAAYTARKAQLGL